MFENTTLVVKEESSGERNYSEPFSIKGKVSMTVDTLRRKIDGRRLRRAWELLIILKPPWKLCGQAMTSVLEESQDYHIANPRPHTPILTFALN